MTDFIYPDMTPGLQAYLDIVPLHPGYKYPKTADGVTTSWTPTPESKAAVEAWEAQLRAFKAALPAEEPAAYYQAHKVWLCRDETAQGEAQEHLSPSGKYRLVVTCHSTGPGTWNYSKGRVYRGDTLITEVCRNYCTFPFAWIEDHPKGDFLVCGSDYQGQTVIDLVSGDRRDFLPTAAGQGAGFCWASIHPNSDKTLLAVCGCYWACPYETIIVDFADPMNPPWGILARDSEDAFAGWTDVDSCQIGTRYEVVNLEGHPLHGKKEFACTIEELEEVDAYVQAHGVPKGPNGEDPGWLEVFETHEWRRGSVTASPEPSSDTLAG